MKKTSILVILFVFPLVAYLFFASGINNFGVLPTLDDQVNELPPNDEGIVLKDHISILSFLGSDLQYKKAIAFNLNQKIYKRFYEFKDFQFVVLVTESAREAVDKIVLELETLGDASNWNFVFLEAYQIEEIYNSLETKEILDMNSATNHVFIIDKDLRQRGREKDDEKHPYPSYDATSVATLTNIMIDDVKILLAEYRLALKRNNATR